MVLYTMLSRSSRRSIPRCVRSYMGGAGEGVATPRSANETALLQRALPRSEAIMARHIRLPDLSVIPESSWGPNNHEALEDIRRKRLIYRSKQRGWLEVDLLLGTWASQNVQNLTKEELDEFEDFVNTETIDIYNLITLRVEEIPERFQSASGALGVVERIQTWAKANPLGKADPSKYKEMKANVNLI